MTEDTIPRYFTASLALLWLWSGVQPVLFAPEVSLALLAQTGVAAPWQWPLLLAAGVWDVLLGIAALTRLRHWPLLWLVQLITVAAYSLIIAVRLPAFWAHPFAPLIKNIPLTAMLFFLFQETRRRA
ncbi:MAG: DoxX-like family protein [Cardiobacteriaceae bacterium]|nr:DoxX-like family protein [Cardiobacteriaceae bacterium]